MIEDLEKRIQIKNKTTYIISTLVEIQSKALSTMTSTEFDLFDAYLTNLQNQIQELDNKFNI